MNAMLSKINQYAEDLIASLYVSQAMTTSDYEWYMAMLPVDRYAAVDSLCGLLMDLNNLWS